MDEKEISPEIKELLRDFVDSSELQESIFLYILKKKGPLKEKELIDYHKDIWGYAQISIHTLLLIDEGEIGVKDRGFIRIKRKAMQKGRRNNETIQ